MTAQVVSPAGSPPVQHPSVLTRRLHAAVTRYMKTLGWAPGDLVSVQLVDQGLGEARVVAYERTFLGGETIRSTFLVVDVHTYGRPGQIEETYVSRISETHGPEDIRLLIRSCYIGPMVQVTRSRARNAAG